MSPSTELGVDPDGALTGGFCPSCKTPTTFPAVLHHRAAELPHEFAQVVCYVCGGHWREEQPEELGRAWAAAYFELREDR